MTKIQIEEVDIELLKPCEYNPRKITQVKMDKLKESLSKYDVVQPILVNKHEGRENVIIGGNQRVKALKELGYKTIPIIFLDLTLEQEKELNLRLNISNGEWNYEMLQKDFGIDLLIDVGFDEEDIGKMFDDILSLENDDFLEDEEKGIGGGVREKKKEDEIQIGDMFQLGEHRLICGDSTNPETLKKLLEDKKVDVFFTDFPYNIGLSYDKGIGGKASYGGEINDSKSEAEYYNFVKSIIENAMQFLKDDAHVFSFCDQNWIYVFQQIYKEKGIKLERVCQWIKTNGFNPVPTCSFNKMTESCVYGKIGKPYIDDRYKNFTEILNKEVTTGNRVSDDILDMIDIWLSKRIAGTEYKHPTQKPVDLYEKPLRRCSKVGDIILDCTSGSGSLLLACSGLKRIFYGIEIQPEFCRVIIDRFEEATGMKAVKIN